MASPNDEVVPNPSKIFGLISIFIASLVAAYFPSASAKFSTLRLPGRALFYAKHFGTGKFKIYPLVFQQSAHNYFLPAGFVQ
jgi:hypothetical protein